MWSGAGQLSASIKNHPVRNLYPLPVLVPLPLPLLVRLQESYKTNENSGLQFVRSDLSGNADGGEQAYMKVRDVACYVYSIAASSMSDTGRTRPYPID